MTYLCLKFNLVGDRIETEIGRGGVIGVTCLDPSISRAHLSPLECERKHELIVSDKLEAFRSKDHSLDKNKAVGPYPTLFLSRPWINPSIILLMKILPHFSLC